MPKRSLIRSTELFGQRRAYRDLLAPNLISLQSGEQILIKIPVNISLDILKNLMRNVLVFNLSEAFSEIKFLKESTIEHFIVDDYKFIIKVLELSLIFFAYLNSALIVIGKLCLTFNCYKHMSKKLYGFKISNFVMYYSDKVNIKPILEFAN